MSSFRVFSSLVAALALVSTAIVADDVEVIETHKAKVVIAGTGDTSVFEADDLEVGESRQFFTDDGREVVILRTEDAFEITVDGEEIGGNTEIDTERVKVMHWVTDGEGDGEGEKRIEIIRLGEGDVDLETGSAFKIFVGEAEGEEDVQVIRLGGEDSAKSQVKIIRRSGGEAGPGEHKKMIFVSSGDEASDLVWVSDDEAHAHGFTFGDGENAIEHLRSSGALDKLDAETREKVLEALEAAERESQDP